MDVFKNFRIGKKGQIIFVTHINSKDQLLHGVNLAAPSLAIKNYRLDEVKEVLDLETIEAALRPKEFYEGYADREYKRIVKAVNEIKGLPFHQSIVEIMNNVFVNKIKRHHIRLLAKLLRDIIIPNSYEIVEASWNKMCQNLDQEDYLEPVNANGVPFHQGIVKFIDECQSPVTLEAIGTIITKTAIVANHASIIAAWEAKCQEIDPPFIACKKVIDWVNWQAQKAEKRK